MLHESPLHKIIQENSLKTGNKCGLMAVHLSERSGIAMPEIKVQLNQLFIDGEISVRDGVHGKLIFIKTKL